MYFISGDDLCLTLCVVYFIFCVDLQILIVQLPSFISRDYNCEIQVF